jgi:hypothetical protein
MMNWMINWTPESDPGDHGDHGVDFTTVIGCRGTSYPCPDICSVDQHIGRLYKLIEATPRQFPELVLELWADVDLLLDRRLWLLLDPQLSDAA